MPREGQSEAGVREAPGVIKTATMTGGQAVVEQLRTEGVEVVFGIPGVHGLPIWDALYGQGDVRSIVARHEQGATYMADGYSRASGKIGVSIATTGPGAANTATAIGEGYANSSRMLHIVTQLESHLIGQFKGGTHDNKDQLGMFQAITAWARHADSPKEIPGLVHEAANLLKSGRPRPMVLEVATDHLLHQDEMAILEAERFERRRGDPAAVAQAAQLLAQAKAPFFVMGGGVIESEAGPELLALAELVQAAIVPTISAKGAIPDDHPLVVINYANSEPYRQLLEGSDLTLAVGTRLAGGATAMWRLPLPQPLIHIDLDETEFNKNYPCQVAILGDAKAVLEQLRQELSRLGGGQRPPRVEAIRAVKEATYQAAKERAPLEIGILEAVRAAAGPNAIMVNDVVQPSYWARAYYMVAQPRTFLYPAYGGLGFGLPAAIGAKVARPDREVIVFMGDGGFMFTGLELATAVQYGINVVCLVFLNEGYATIRWLQDTRYRGRYIDWKLRNPDFVKLAEALGAKGVWVPSPEGLEAALRQELPAPQPTVIAVPAETTTPF